MVSFRRPVRTPKASPVPAYTSYLFANRLFFKLDAGITSWV
jgi:hypothetical protein